MDAQLRAQQRAGSRLDNSQQRPALPVVPTVPRAPAGRRSAQAQAKNVVRATAAQSGASRAVAPLAASTGALCQPVLMPEVVVEPAAEPSAYEPKVADMEEILAERDACGVGFIASLKNIKSHTVVKQALTALGCMEHRGACSADNDSGDGAGLMTQIPWKLLKKEMPQLNELTTGVGMVFMPNNDELEAQCKQILESVCAKEGVKVLGWRKVPVDHDVVGRFARVTEPRIWQVLIEGKPGQVGDELERELFVVRKLVEKAKNAQLPVEFAPDFYLCTLSSRTIVYKGMLRSAVVGSFYRDLENPDFESAFAIYHRRFSTNTTPKWPLAQPMRVLGHNGEINTLQGNLNWVVSREHELNNPIWKGRESELTPLCNAAQSDSANLDNVAELLVRTGFDPQEALMLLVPEAYRNHPDLVKEYPEVIDFYEFYEGLQEGWDGPALLVFSDGKRVGARLDRNGLRPARFWRTKDDMIYVASEVGVLGDVISNADNIVAKGRLGPGQMVCADLEKATFMETGAISKMVATRQPYKEWLQKGLRRLADLGESTFLNEPMYDSATMLRLQAAIGMGAEDATMVVESQAQTGVEPTYCMGDDIPLAVLSDKPHMLYNYFKQRFAQVTNPPIDPLREGLVMSLEMRLGARGNLLAPGADSYKQVQLDSPILLESELQAVASDKTLGTKSFKIFFEAGKEGSLEAALRKLCTDVEAAVRAGCQCVVLSDRPDASGMDAGRAPIPALLAVGAVHHHLIRTSLRSDTSIVADTATCFSTHHAAMLIGFGAHAICPYLGYETSRQWRLSSRTQSLIKAGKVPDISVQAAQKNFKKSLEKGVLKILSKMGISLLSCYHGAQIFEAYGLGKDVVDMCFRGTVSRIGGMSLADLQREAESLWTKGFPEKAMTKLEEYGFIQSRPKGEYHSNNQEMAKLLHKAIGLGNGSQANPEAYKAYQQHFAEAPVAVLRDCLDFKSDRAPIPIDQVEPAAAIMERFCTGGMSLGAISRETHETIAIAMNRIGGKSNSGEGGEDPTRWLKLADVDEAGKSASVPHLRGLRNGDTATSKIKQVASGRFGVTPEYIMNADQLEIKVAQGAKPGEGGQLPGQKVSPYIAQLRRSKPGVPLISPPPHHDIYSIEDLAQLIYDLHQVNPKAKVSVKLVAEAGIGVVASGVAKANADIIQVSGHDGGTGASPISSIKHAGGPMEMGLAETHQTLVRNELRERVVLRVDGGVRNGRDVLLGALLGADEFGFGTVAMIATGCIMARVCHTNNCPVGVASQREELRARFPGAPEDLVNYFHFVAEEVRASLAEMGYRSLDEVIGRADLLTQRTVKLAKTDGLDLSFLTTFAGASGASSVRRAQEVHDNGPQLDDRILADAEVMDAIVRQRSVQKAFDIINTDRSALGRVAGVIAKHHGDNGFAGHVRLTLTGSGGQSFGCFCIKGLEVKLVGEANDYVGKGMNGGEIAIVPPPGSPFRSEDASLVGNTCLYGATGGRLFVNGRAGERFAVRNSMAEAVVEGAGDHCCEYMTGGCVVVLGSVGRNVAAGMTGGLGYFLDEDGSFCDKVNTEIVAVQRVVTTAGEAHLKGLISAHADRTGSAKAKALLANWEASLGKFWQLVPPAEKNTPEVNPSVVVPQAAKVAVTA
ncbi:Ferredoxin-dependent glutamate synthase 1, chloroplastic/mitochondrial [Pleodorina starrii]|uniref:glutamate synthase (ferredoxin) n=1 Tax=Pleodorina starrii TaxID=330485 RepID=A0A9W6BVW9_9CHLO|nr:Ferredoxin-dependent glutamate synthase 1 [Pleodorina starrii]GLC59207.1 Ferredoxin-dependent glutamate synthase 1, chloroplastic/mitochondrial [Pleodorina starrii]GLC74770.1 Ferredoxin-dependent glutamate synthase 1 [Pleodorina starrii]